MPDSRFSRFLSGLTTVVIAAIACLALLAMLTGCAGAGFSLTGHNYDEHGTRHNTVLGWEASSTKAAAAVDELDVPPWEKPGFLILNLAEQDRQIDAWNADHGGEGETEHHMPPPIPGVPFWLEASAGALLYLFGSPRTRENTLGMAGAAVRSVGALAQRRGKLAVAAAADAVTHLGALTPFVRTPDKDAGTPAAISAPSP